MNIGLAIENNEKQINPILYRAVVFIKHMAIMRTGTRYNRADIKILKNSCEKLIPKR